MEPSAAAPGPFRFGLFEADLASGELRKRGRKVPLQEQPFQVLALLLRHAGKVVTREELQRALWPADTFVEFEQGLNTAIKRLRLALGDSADNPRFVETLPRKGYRLIAPVGAPGPLAAEVPAADAAPVATPVAPVAAAQRRRWVWAAAALISLSLALAGVIWWSRVGREPRAHWEMVPFTNYPGIQAYPSFSPDGNQVVFVWTKDRWRSSQLHRKQVGSLLPVQLTAKPALDLSPAFSPDGTSIGFIRCQEKQAACAFATIPQTGGAERIVADLLAPGKSGTDAYEFYSHIFGPIFAWLPDGKHVVVDGLTLLTVQSGEQRPLTSPPPGVWPDFSPDVSPDGHSVAFARAANNESKVYLLKSSIYLLDLGADLRPKGEPRRLTFFEGLSHDASWSPDGSRIVFVSPAGRGSELNSDPRLWVVGASGSVEPEQLSFHGIWQVALSRAGNRLVYGSQMSGGSQPDQHIWRFRLSDSREAIGPPVRFDSSMPEDSNPQYSPEGKRVAFEVMAERAGIWVGDADGSNLTEVYSHPPALLGTPRWAPDGERLAFDCYACNADFKWRVYVIRAGGGKPVLLTPGLAGGAIPSWSADGKWVYFSSTVNRQSQIWKTPADGGSAARVTRKGGLVAFESQDGKTLYYTKHDMDEVGGLWKMPVGGGEEELVIPSVVGRNFAAAGTGLYFVESAGEQTFIRYLAFATGKVQTISPIPPWGFGISVSPDERSLLVTRPDEHATGLTLVENFRP